MTRLGVMSSSLGYLRPYKLVTVSKHPEKATIMVKRLAEMLDDRYIVIHAANCERIEEVKFRVRDLEPDMLLKADVDMCALPEDSPSEKSADLLLLRMKKDPMTVRAQ
ncbi:hypothetical protein LTR70_006858 [Exophiala xenobiotica]|uniref:Uncharacterized protein n=1 Tax=Lithohypha guttulata TaxID=1690604 RepID=A0ABR0K7Y9_9EURO|nr:hypothetical protein LTR24_006407 [Lithohypha guttulata]KAK5315119.1 hypothetical protein LTR70_006858 [Exophiala xenobiotica]